MARHPWREPRFSMCDCLLVFLPSPVLIRLPAYFFHQLGELHQIWDVSLMRGMKSMYASVFGCISLYLVRGSLSKAANGIPFFVEREGEGEWRWRLLLGVVCPQEISRFVCSKFIQIQENPQVCLPPKVASLAIGVVKVSVLKAIR